MNSSQYKKNELKKLCSVIGFKSSEIEQIVNNLDDYYKEKVEIKIDKKTGKPKTYIDGTEKIRIIHPSYKALKRIQSKIKDKILVPIELPNNVHGGVKRRSNITNAKPHQGKKYQFTTDLQDFYPSISSKRVYNTFLNLSFTPHVSYWLTKLTTWKYKLPQGTPTSTHISNLVFLDTDVLLIELCNKHNITYTRYVDDLTFSCQQDFSPLLSEILDIVKAGGFNISYRKTRYKGKQIITGVEVFLHKIDAPSHIIEKSKIELTTNDPNKSYTIYRNNITKTNKRKTK